MLKGLFDTGRCPTTKAGEYLAAVLKNFRNGETLNRAAGKALPILGLPLFEDCFSSLNEIKMAQDGTLRPNCSPFRYRTNRDGSRAAVANIEKHLGPGD